MAKVRRETSSTGHVETYAQRQGIAAVAERRESVQRSSGDRAGLWGWLSETRVHRESREPIPRISRWSVAIVIGYLAAIAGAELISALVDPVAGTLLHLAVLLCLVFHSSFADDDGSRKLYIALALAPLISIVATTLPGPEQAIYSYFVICIPVLVGSVVVMRILGFSLSNVGLCFGKNPPIQGFVALTGIGFGIAEYGIVHPDPLIDALTLRELLPAVVVFAVATAFVEELCFRGVIQRSITEGMRAWGWVYVACLFAVLHIGYLSVLDLGYVSGGYLLFVMAMGLFLGWSVERTGSLIGVTFSRSVANAGAYLVIPLLV